MFSYTNLYNLFFSRQLIFYGIAGCATHLYVRNFEHQAASLELRAVSKYNSSKLVAKSS